jgi:hypothetical protein
MRLTLSLSTHATASYGKDLGKSTPIEPPSQDRASLILAAYFADQAAGARWRAKVKDGGVFPLLAHDSFWVCRVVAW